MPTFPAEIRARIARYEELRHLGKSDSSAAFCLRLYRDVLFEIASRNCPDPGTLAQEALRAELTPEMFHRLFDRSLE